MEDYSQESFQESQLPILYKRFSYGFSLTGKQYKMKEHREKSPIPFILQTSTKSLSYQLHNSMFKELFGKALKWKNKKQEARRKNKLNRKKWKGNLLTVEMGA